MFLSLRVDVRRSGLGLLLFAATGVGCVRPPTEGESFQDDDADTDSHDPDTADDGGTTGIADDGNLTTSGPTEIEDPSTSTTTTIDPTVGEETGDDGPVDEVPPDQSMECDDRGGAAGVLLQAECAHGIGCPSGIGGQQSGTELENGDSTIGYFEPGDWISFSDVPLDGVTTALLRFAKGEGDGALEFRLGSASGRVLGRFTPSVTGGWQSFEDASVSLDGASGTDTVVIVATGTTSVANLDWIDLGTGAGSGPAPDGGTASEIRVNHVGFEQTGPKHAVIRGEDLQRFTVQDGQGQVRWCGDLSPVNFDAWGGGTYYVADFSGLSVSGSYRVVAGGLASETFTIGADLLFDETLAAVVGYFRGSRANDEDVWGTDAAVPIADSDRTADVRGGWYDASGDISKYLSHLNYANFMSPQQIPLVAWALAHAYEGAGARLEARGWAADVQSEALWGADYLLRVLDPEGYFYINVFDGWSGFMGARQVCAFEGESGAISADYQAAFREGGGMSIAALARIGAWGTAGSFSAEEYLEGAKRAYAHLETMGPSYTDDGVENVIDDYTALLAATELYAATEEASFLEGARRRAAALQDRLHGDGYFVADDGDRPFWHASDAGLPVVALVRYIEVEPDESLDRAAIDTIDAHLEYLLAVTGEVANPFGYARQHFRSGGSLQSGFFIPHDNETGYWWQGENARLASLAAAAMMGGRVLDPSDRQILGIDSRLARFAGRQLDWILGTNPFDISFLNGFGRNNPPEYAAYKPQVDTHVGGISNGITGAEDNGAGIQWLNGDPETPWADWRWVEQWLPHSAWYLVAITSLRDD